MKKEIKSLIFVILLILLTILLIILGFFFGIVGIISPITTLTDILIGYFLNIYKEVKKEGSIEEIYREKVIAFLESVKKNNAHSALTILENYENFFRLLDFGITWEKRDNRRYVIMRDDIFNLEIWKMAIMTLTDYLFRGQTYSDEYKANNAEFVSTLGIFCRFFSIFFLFSKSGSIDAFINSDRSSLFIGTDP